MYIYTPRSIKFVLYIHVAQKISVAVKHDNFFKNLSVLLIKDQPFIFKWQVSHFKNNIKH